MSLFRRFFKHFVSKNQLPGLSISGTLGENGLRLKLESRHLKVMVKCELSTLANKSETMPPNLWKTVNAQREHVNENVEYYNRISVIYKKNLNSKNETIKSLLGIQSTLIESINKSTVNELQ